MSYTQNVRPIQIHRVALLYHIVNNSVWN